MLQLALYLAFGAIFKPPAQCHGEIVTIKQQGGMLYV